MQEVNKNYKYKASITESAISKISGSNRKDIKLFFLEYFQEIQKYNNSIVLQSLYRQKSKIIRKARHTFKKNYLTEIENSKF